MVNEYEIPHVAASAATGVTATIIDSTTYRFPQSIDLTGISDKFGGGVDFTRWQKRMKLWLMLKGLWSVIQYEKPVLVQENVDSIKVYSMWEERDGAARDSILAALANTLFDVYSSDTYTAKLLWEKLDQTHNTNSQGLKKCFVARYLNFKLVDYKSMTEQAYEFEVLVHDLKDSGMDLPEKFQIMSLIEKLPNSWKEFAFSLKRQKGNMTWTSLMREISMQEQQKSKQTYVMPAEYEDSKTNLVNLEYKSRHVTKKKNNKSKLKKNKTKKPKTNKSCWCCGQIGHWRNDCPLKKTNKLLW